MLFPHVPVLAAAATLLSQYSGLPRGGRIC